MVNLVIRFIRWNLSRRFDPFDWFVEHGDTWNVNFCSSSVYGSRLKEIPSTYSRTSDTKETLISLSPITTCSISHSRFFITDWMSNQYEVFKRAIEAEMVQNWDTLHHCQSVLFWLLVLCFSREERSAGLYHIHSTNKEEKLSGSSLCCFWYDIDRLYNTYFVEKDARWIDMPRQMWLWCISLILV